MSLPSEETLRHNFLLRRHLTDPGYGASREVSWREKAANGLGVPYVHPRVKGGKIAPGYVEGLLAAASPSESPDPRCTCAHDPDHCPLM